MTSLNEAVEQWAWIALERRWAEDWVEGAIFPREMVAFLALCDARDVSAIVESGRQDGYSTGLLAQYAEARNGLVVSIDDEPDAERAGWARERLETFTNLSLKKGDAFLDFGDQVRRQRPSRCAVLVDGPKGFEAMTLTFAAAWFKHVIVIGQHNLNRGAPDTQIFQARARSPIHYEDITGFQGSNWDRLTEVERDFCTGAGARRSMDQSSLGIVDLTVSSRSRLWRTTNRNLRFHQPWLVAILWRVGRFRSVARLFYLSFRWASRGT